MESLEANESSRPELDAMLEELEHFKKGWIYASIRELLEEKYQTLFNEAVGLEDTEKRVFRLEQMKGVAYAMETISMIEEAIKEKIEE